MNTPYHCGFFLKLWDQLLGGLYPTEVPVQCTVYIMHYFNLYSYSTEMSTSQTFYPHHTLSIIFCLFSWRKSQSLMLFYRDSRSPFFDLLQFNDIDLKIFRRRGASVQSVPGRSQLFDEKKS